MQKDNKQLVPLAIVIAGALIALSIYFGGKTDGVTLLPQGTTGNNAVVNVDAPDVSPSEHILGNKDAHLMLVEYSDFECPFCKVFHGTVHQVVNTFKPSDVAIVYRQFPIVGLHSKAPKEAEASECVAELGGNTAFWKFADEVFSTTGSNDSLDPSQLPIIAGHAGVDVSAFNNCLSSGKYTKLIQDDVLAAGKAGAQGTPYSIIITKSPLTTSQKSTINSLEVSNRGGVKLGGDNKVIISGAQPFEVVKATIDALLK